MKKYLSIAILIATVLFRTNGFAGDYQPKTIISANWGQRDGEFGLITQAEGNCPQSLTVDSHGNIAILDLVNKRVQVYSSGGKWLSKFNFTCQAFDIQFFNQQIVLLAPYDYTIEQYDYQGKLLKKMKINRDIGFINGLRAINNKMFVQTIDQTQFNISDQSISRQLQTITPGLSAQIPDLRFQTRWIDAHQGNLFIENNRTGKKQTIIIKTQDELGSLVFLDTDKLGNIYIRKELFAGNGESYFEIDKLDSKGNVILTVQIKNENIVAPFKPITIDQLGNIYFLEISSEKFAVIRWQEAK